MNEKDIPEFLSPGHKTVIGTHTFHAEEIIRFGKQFDPQKFHVDAVAAGESMLGGLCASGWHTVSVWMKLQRRSIAEMVRCLKSEGKPYPEFGPSPGMRNLKWLHPVYAGDTITYLKTAKEIRQSKSKPGWWIFSNESSGKNQNGEPVIEFTSTVFIQFRSASEPDL